MKVFGISFSIGFIISFIFALTACATNPETGESEFIFGDAVACVVDKFQAVPDEVKAGSLDAIAWVLGATGVGGVGAILAQKGANYYRNRAASKRAVPNVGDETSTVADVSSDEHEPSAGKV